MQKAYNNINHVLPPSAMWRLQIASVKVSQERMRETTWDSTFGFKSKIWKRWWKNNQRVLERLTFNPWVIFITTIKTHTHRHTCRHQALVHNVILWWCNVLVWIRLWHPTILFYFLHRWWYGFINIRFNNLKVWGSMIDLESNAKSCKETKTEANESV